MSRSIGIEAVLLALMMLGLTSEAQSQERARLVGEASCIDAQGRYVITWTLTLTLGAQETASAESPAADFDGLDLIAQPQGDDYPFLMEAGNIFTAARGRLVNGPNVARTQMDTRIYNPDTIQASGRIKSPGAQTEIDVTVNRPAVCAA